MAHVIGQGQFLEDGGSAPSSGGTSLAVQQFLALARGTVAPHAPHQPWRVVALTVEERYCLRCFGLRRCDALVGVDRKFTICRGCGEEVMHG